MFVQRSGIPLLLMKSAYPARHPCILNFEGLMVDRMLEVAMFCLGLFGRSRRVAEPPIVESGRNRRERNQGHGSRYCLVIVEWVRTSDVHFALTGFLCLYGILISSRLQCRRAQRCSDTFGTALLFCVAL
jgi:hypothetical protein